MLKYARSKESRVRNHDCHKKQSMDALEMSRPNVSPLVATVNDALQTSHYITCEFMIIASEFQ